jgi:hypothetical protein
MEILVTDRSINIPKERTKNIFKLATTFSMLGNKGEFGSDLGIHICNTATNWQKIWEKIKNLLASKALEQHLNSQFPSLTTKPK